MEDDQKFSINKWKDIMKCCLDPGKIMDALPDYFPLNSDARSRVQAKLQTPHEAVDIMLGELMKVPDAFQHFMAEVRRDQDHEWLYPLVTGKLNDDEIDDEMVKIDHWNYVNKFLSVHLPQIYQDLKAKEISSHFKAKGVLTQEDDEKVQAKVDNFGNIAGVRHLLSILARKPPGWIREFKQIMRDENYNIYLTDIFDDLPDDYNSFHGMSSSHEEPTPPTPHRKATSGISDFPIEKDMVFQEDVEQNDAAIRMHELHGTAVHVRETIPLSSPPPNNIIPKEARYNTPLARSRQLVRGEQSLIPEQRRLARRTIHGENVIIFAPAGPDRSRMIVHIIQSRFPHIFDSLDRKIAVIVSKITKQQSVIKSCFASKQWDVAFCDENAVDSLSRTLESHQVVVITPRALLNWLSGESDVRRITEFDMLVMDECDKVYGDGPQKEIQKRYLEVKQTKPAHNLPQIIGLFCTAGRTTQQFVALDYLKNLCALMDAKGGIEFEAALADVKPPLQRSKSGPKRQNSNIGNDCIRDPFTLCLCEAMDEVVKVLYIHDIRKLKDPRSPHSKCKGTNEYSQWCRELHQKTTLLDRPDDQSLKSNIARCASVLQAFNHALYIKNNCRAEDSLDKLEEEFKQCFDTSRRGNARVTETRLRRIFTDAVTTLQSCIRDPRVTSSTLNDMEKALATELKKNKTTKAVLLVSDSELMGPLQAWLNSCEALRNFCVDVMKLEDKSVVSNAAKNRKILADFKTGGNKIIISPSTIFPTDTPCDLILCYDCTVANPSSAKTKGKGAKKCPSSMTFSPAAIIANDKVKIDQSLQIEIAAKKLQGIRNDNQGAYVEDIEKRQSKLLGNQMPRHCTSRRDTKEKTLIL